MPSTLHIEGIMKTVITTHKLTKRFKGHTAVDGLNLSIPEGVV